jgi:hypothetical protein
LAELASKEQNPSKLTELLRKLNEALDRHLRRHPSTPDDRDRQFFPLMGRPRVLKRGASALSPSRVVPS